MTTIQEAEQRRREDLRNVRNMANELARNPDSVFCFRRLRQLADSSYLSIATIRRVVKGQFNKANRQDRPIC